MKGSDTLRNQRSEPAIWGLVGSICEEYDILPIDLLSTILECCEEEIRGKFDQIRQKEEDHSEDTSNQLEL